MSSSSFLIMVDLYFNSYWITQKLNSSSLLAARLVILSKRIRFRFKFKPNHLVDSEKVKEFFHPSREKRKKESRKLS